MIIQARNTSVKCYVVELSEIQSSLKIVTAEKFPAPLWSLNVHCRVHESPPLDTILSQLNPLRIKTLCFCVIRFNTLLSLHLRPDFASHPFPFGFPVRNVYASQRFPIRTTLTTHLISLMWTPWLQVSLFTDACNRPDGGRRRVTESLDIGLLSDEHGALAGEKRRPRRGTAPECQHGPARTVSDLSLILRCQSPQVWHGSYEVGLTSWKLWAKKWSWPNLVDIRAFVCRNSGETH
jgi:hypothetical protein